MIPVFTLVPASIAASPLAGYLIKSHNAREWGKWGRWPHSAFVLPFVMACQNKPLITRKDRLLVNLQSALRAYCSLHCSGGDWWRPKLHRQHACRAHVRLGHPGEQCANL